MPKTKVLKKKPVPKKPETIGTILDLVTKMRADIKWLIGEMDDHSERMEDLEKDRAEEYEDDDDDDDDDGQPWKVRRATSSKQWDVYYTDHDDSGLTVVFSAQDNGSASYLADRLNELDWPVPHLANWGEE